MNFRDLTEEDRTRLQRQSNVRFKERSVATNNWVTFGKAAAMTPEEIWRVAFSEGVKATLETL